jgi:histidyl-tRNA synthetase
MPGLSGVGISFGVDRIYDVLNALDLYPKDSLQTTQVLFINFGERETAYCLPIINKVRAKGIRAEIYPDAAKMKKQMAYANAKQTPYVVLAGDNEMQQGRVTLKDMETGQQQLLTPDELIAALSE